MNDPRFASPIGDYSWSTRVMGVAVFLLLAASLSLPSGYSLGGILLLLLSVFCWPRSWRARASWPAPIMLWAVVILAMAGIWTLHNVARVDGQWVLRSRELDRAAKYVLMLLVLPAFLVLRPRMRAVYWGCFVGAAAAGGTALWQVYVLGQHRADGYTNAIQFGDLSLLLGLWCVIWARQLPNRWLRAFGWLCAALGLIASLASGSRGGWIVLPILLLIIVGFERLPPWRRPRRVVAAALVIGACLSVLLLPSVQQRFELAASEVSEYVQHGNMVTSVGNRLGLWRFVGREASAHPLLGYGELGYQQRLREAVHSGALPPEVLRYDHAHNEWLDMLIKRGALGVFVLLLFYGVPGVIAWRHLRHGSRSLPQGEIDVVRTAALCGLITVVGFLVFGATQVVFAHNSGNMMYLFCTSLWLALCCGGTAEYRQEAQRGQG